MNNAVCENLCLGQPDEIMDITKENPHKAIYKGYYYAVIPGNMAIPKAIFLSEVEAIKYSGDERAIRCLPLPESLFLQALNQCSNLP